MDRVFLLLEGGAAEAPSPRRAATGARPRVLIVDDDRAFADGLAHFLREKGFDARAAWSARDALHLAFETFPPDALVADVHLPGFLDGWNVARLVRSACPDVVVFLATGAERGSVPDLPYRVFYKPVKAEALAAALGRALGLAADGP